MTTPREIFARMQRQWFSDEATLDHGLLADDVVVEMPFALPGQPNRIQGRQNFIAFAEAGRAALPVRFEGCRNVVVHETADPNVIVVEYELAATLTTTGVSAAAPFIGVLRVRDGLVTHWREYQNPLAIAQALGQR